MHDHNRRAWDAMVQDRQRFTRPARDEDFANPLKTVDGLGWLGPSIRGQKVLCLAAGGGKHGPLYAAAGALTTVVDISPGMLELDREVAAERRLELRTIEASMDDLACFQTGEFDLVVQPVSTCYVPEIGPVYREVARITRPGGLYISQHKTPQSLQADVQAAAKGYELSEPYYRTGPLPAVVGSRHREEGTLEYLHRWEELIGLLCRSGFVLEDLVEPLHAKADAVPGSWEHRSRFVAPYVRLKARRLTTGGDNLSQPASSSRLWLPT